ncbi:MAG: hypothetical protein ACTSR3_11555, partial [Candidatus Helarchaeota archaeon]
MEKKSRVTIKRVMICLSLCMLTGLFINTTLNSGINLGIKDLSFHGLTSTSLIIFGIGLNKFSDFFTSNGDRVELEQDTRSRIYNLIVEDEGIHLREVC